ncbi:DNA-directed RNA polymerase subunit delta [Lysinibacillus sp. 2017]|uniref:DNA-directed RNA polymerase subunit delta n=1 Tax=unclassified Lysinibacillus TaxID=2636778 RepID=UPI000D527CFC|nr:MULTISPECIES: DNA-directed RNA polymerase subunit delta [unclassified Lysinibacillus]AWE06278.1 DNA-directed RNA polymerase subunit delta [Lysinibacillus sp. 2017]TGN35246.1 DNA-directed RNA polymerase subunit delta [Lysinibacillus sp. S2017]
MHDLNFRGMTDEQLAEESLIDLAYAILEDRKQAMPLNELLKEIQTLNGISDARLKSRLVQFYTDLNVEGRFLLNQENGWGLREWYKIETIEEETAPTIKARKKKAKVVEDEEELTDLDEEDVLFEEDYDEFVEEEEEEEEETEDIDFVEEVIDPDLDGEIIEEDETFIIEDEDEDLDEDEDELEK